MLSMCAAPLYGIPAKKGVHLFTQADGTTIEVQLVGDEFAHMYLTADGYPLVERGGMYYYADVDADGKVEATTMKVQSTRSAEVVSFLNKVDKKLVDVALQRKAALSVKRNVPAGAGSAISRAPQGPGLSPGSNFPVTGSPHVLVILAEYSDVKMSTSNAHDYFSRMMTERGFSDYGGTGSALDFFDENSMGQFTPQIDVYGPVTLPNTRHYYGANNDYGNDDKAHLMIVDACKALDADVDFSKYDTDGDGIIDNVFVFYAGRGEADGGPLDSVWPHAWWVYQGGGMREYFDGVLLDHYACSNEWTGMRPDGVGTFIHEFSHVMGLPDLYATNNNRSVFTPGAWSTLDYGPYNNNGRTPPNYSAYERYALGWIEPVLIDGPVTAELPPIANNICGIIKTAKENEYFLFENRQQSGWDTYIPGHGMLVWHVDYQGSKWSQNVVNNTASHQYVDIEEADGTQSEYSRAGDAFPGTAGVTSFTDDTKPSMKTWAGVGLGLPITDIVEDYHGYITFNVAGGGDSDVNGPVAAPVANAATDVSYTEFTANWAAEENLDCKITVYSKDASGAPVYTQYRRFNVGKASSFKISGLEYDTQYYYTVCASRGFYVSAESPEVAVRTLRPGIEVYPVVATGATGVSENGFTANWDELPEATSYLLTVKRLDAGEPLEFTANFDDNIMPSGWSATNYTFNSIANRFGEAAPSVSIIGGNSITSPQYGNIYSISFWHRSTTTAKGVLKVNARVGSGWQTVQELPIVSTVGGATYTVDLPEDCSTVQIFFDGAKSVAIDDIKVSYGHAVVRSIVEPYDRYDVGNVTSYFVGGLSGGQDYSYVVSAIGGDKESMESTEMRLRTLGQSGISSVVTDDGVEVVADGGRIRVTGVAAGETVAVYDVAGRMIGSAKGDCTFTPGASGLYIVRVGAASAKIIL